MKTKKHDKASLLDYFTAFSAFVLGGGTISLIVNLLMVFLFWDINFFLWGVFRFGFVFGFVLFIYFILSGGMQSED